MKNDLIKRNYQPHIVGIAIEKAKYMKRSDVLKKKKLNVNNQTGLYLLWHMTLGYQQYSQS